MSNSDHIKTEPVYPIKDLNDDVAKGIGHVIAKWSYLENLLRITTYNLLGISQGEGRLASREPDIKNTVFLIRDLAVLNDITLTGGDITKLGNSLEEYAQYRNALAHGLWVDLNGETYLRVTYGTWTPPKGTKVSRKVYPQGWPITGEALRELLNQLESFTAAVEIFSQQIYLALSSSPRKLPPLLKPSSLHNNQN